MNEKVMESLKGSVNSAASIVVIFGITIITICASILLAVQVGKCFVFSTVYSLHYRVFYVTLQIVMAVSIRIMVKSKVCHITDFEGPDRE